jgi:polar amino acid transport system permease protein
MHSFDWNYTFGLLRDHDFWRASLVVVELSVPVWLISNAFGIVLALMQESRLRVLRALSSAYVWFFRSLPLLVLLVFIYNTPQVLPGTRPFLGSAFAAGLISMVLNEAAFMAEIHRGGLLSVGTGQREAARALGLPYSKVQRLVVIPQAFRIALPANANEFISILKLTSLVCTISLSEILLTGQQLYTNNFKVLETLTGVAFYYIVLVTIFDRLRVIVERRLDVTRRKVSKVVPASDLRVASTAGVRRPRREHVGDRLVKVRGVTKRFGDTEVLHGVDFDVHAGEVVVIIGPSGSGKTTLARTLNHLESVTEGRVEVNGHLVGYRIDASGKLREERESVVSVHRRDIGMVFQSFNLFPHRKVIDNVLLAPRTLKRLPSDRAEEEGMALLERVGLRDHAQKYPHQLSGGQQQRVAIARAMAMKPAVMVFDEPTSAMDPELVGEVLDVLDELANAGMTMVVVTHEMRLAREVADWVVFMDDGKILVQGPPEELFGDRTHERMRKFLSKIERGGAPRPLLDIHEPADDLVPQAMTLRD